MKMQVVNLMLMSLLRLFSRVLLVKISKIVKMRKKMVIFKIVENQYEYWKEINNDIGLQF